MSTARPGPAPAVTALVRGGVEFTLHPYDLVEYDDGAELAELLDVEEERVVEAVVVEAGGRAAMCLVVAGDELDEEAVGTALGAPARIVLESVAERVTGHPADAVSPFGTRRRLPALVDAGVADLGPATTVIVPSGQAGLAVEVRLSDLLRVTEARRANIVSA
ncbi:MAG TPA: YbaK/EbsC family protein [Acidimicrobiales bacterium]|nr:YbaK/EbsC family protein [Acidimicrobiales bacterium]